MKKTIYALAILLTIGFLMPKETVAQTDNRNIIVFIIPKTEKGKALGYYNFQGSVAEWQVYRDNKLKPNIKKNYGTEEYGFAFLIQGECGYFYSSEDSSGEKGYGLTKHKSITEVSTDIIERRERGNVFTVIIQKCVD